MQTKVEIFQESDVDALQKLINNWLENNPKIHVEHVAQSQIQHGEHMSMPVTVSVWYTVRQ